MMDNPFALLSFLAAPAILTNASTLLVLSTSNRLARASDLARASHGKILASTSSDDPMLLERGEFESACQRAKMLVMALSNYYFSAGAFAGGTCIALLGAFAGYFHVDKVAMVAQALTAVAAVLGVGGLVMGSVKLVAETRLALRSLSSLHASITRWRVTKQLNEGSAATGP